MDIEQKILAKQQEIIERENEVLDLKSEVERIKLALELEKNEVELLRERLDQIHRSRGWRYANRVHLLRKRMFPQGSIPYYLARGFYKFTSSIYHVNVSSIFRPLKHVWISARSNIIPTARFVYHKLPLPYAFKRRLVSLSFRYCGPLFTGQAQYIDWTKKQLDAHKWTSLQDIDPATGSHDVFVLSIINWDFRIQRPQHLARGLSKTHRVFYIEVDMSSTDFRMRKIDENLYVINFPIAGGKVVQPYTGMFDPDQVRDWLGAMKYFCDFSDATSFKSIIIEHPQWWPLARHLPPEFRIIFDCMDDISGFSNTTPELLELEDDMLKNCDDLIVSSQYLFDKYSKFKSPALVRNGGEITHFKVNEFERSLPKFLEDKGFSQSSGRIRAGYVGAIAEWFDADLIAKAAEENPDIEFHLCGSVTASAPGRLAVFDNVILYGEIVYTDVPAFIERMDVLLIPFQLLPIIQACDPVKFYEYSAMGKPTVTTRLPELTRAEKLAFFASDSTEFAAQIRIAAEKGKDQKFRTALRAYAMENTWMHRVEQVKKVLLDLPKVSVVILSYGDPKWTAATLESLYEKGGNYPNLEVIVVDNGSKPEWLAEIRLQAMRYPDVTVIENGENLGFAKGNNVGIGAATGDYVFLLNNDTYVAPGSIHAMVRHLERNKEIGIVGPLTNNIGNEAKIFVNYATMAEMRSIAFNITTGYRGVFTSLPVLAYFAVMFRKRDIDDVFGYISEEYGRGMFEDDDHCALIRSKGYICALAEDAFVHHHLSGTFNTVLPKEKQALFDANKKIFESKWGDWKPHQYRSNRPRSTIVAEE